MKNENRRKEEHGRTGGKRERASGRHESQSTAEAVRRVQTECHHDHPMMVLKSKVRGRRKPTHESPLEARRKPS